MEQPLIGILAHMRNTSSEVPVMGQNAQYVEYFRNFGNVVLIDAGCQEVLPIDLLVLPGGRDVNPANYGAVPSIHTQYSDPMYDYFYKFILPKYMEKIATGKMACYGICAGFQGLNVYFGGSISQDIPQAHSTDSRGQLVDTLNLLHERIPSQVLNRLPEELLFPSNQTLIKSQLSGPNRRTDLKVNSIHHQGVYMNQLGKGLVSLATNAAFDNVEYFHHDTMLIAAEQAHPEERGFNMFSTSLTEALISSFLDTVAENKQH